MKKSKKELIITFRDDCRSEALRYNNIIKNCSYCNCTLFLASNNLELTAITENYYKFNYNNISYKINKLAIKKIIYKDIEESEMNK